MDILLFLHILGAATWIGAAAAIGFGGSALSSEHASIRAGWYRFVGRSSKLLISPASVIVLVTGVLLVVSESSYGFGSTFVSIGFLAIIIGSGIGMGFTGPRSREAAVALDNGDTSTADPLVSRMRGVSSLELLLLAVTVAAMVWKW